MQTSTPKTGHDEQKYENMFCFVVPHHSHAHKTILPKFNSPFCICYNDFVFIQAQTLYMLITCQLDLHFQMFSPSIVLTESLFKSQFLRSETV